MPFAGPKSKCKERMQKWMEAKFKKKALIDKRM